MGNSTILFPVLKIKDIFKDIFCIPSLGLNILGHNVVHHPASDTT
jgi:hypothetical protein